MKRGSQLAPIFILRGIPLFDNLSNDDLNLIATRLTKERYAKGDCVFREGDVGDTMYLVESGQLSVLGVDEVEIAKIGPGDFVGEISLILAQPRTASLRVAIDAELWALRKQDFDELITTRPSMGVEMMRVLSQRLVTTTHSKRRLAARQFTALLTPLDSAGRPQTPTGMELAEALYRQLNRPIGVLPLPGIELDTHFTAEGGVVVLDNDYVDQSYLAKILSYQIEKYKHIIMLVPDKPNPLVEKAIELSDTIVSVGAVPGWITTQVTNQDVWISTGAKNDLGRIARRLTNRTIGLALSSGGSRGLAHLGVIKVLMEENIPIDLVAGTSAGALFGTFFAAGWSWDRFETLIEEMKSVNRLANWDFNIPPRTAILKGKKARDKIIDRWTEGRKFEDLKTPLFMVAADILTGEEVVFESGSLTDAIRASLSIPVLVDPWHYRGHYFVDGGIVNPLPASVLRKKGADIVIASSVIQPLRDSYGGRMDRMPNFLQVVFNMFSSMEAEVVTKQLPLIDVLIHHKVSASHTLDFENVNALVEIGERSARQMLPQVKAAVEASAGG